MKRVLIIALASIFIVNLLTMKPKAETIYDNGTLSSITETNENGIFSSSISGDYSIEANKKYKITLNIPIVNGVIAENFEINAGRVSKIIVKTNNEITYKESIKSLTYTNGVLVFVYEGPEIDSTITKRFRYYLSGYEPNTQVETTTNGNPLKIETYEIPSDGEILIENVKNAPKDVLREVVAVLPVVITVCIAYIATRKGISFVRYILESA